MAERRWAGFLVVPGGVMFQENPSCHSLILVWKAQSLYYRACGDGGFRGRKNQSIDLGGHFKQMLSYNDWKWQQRPHVSLQKTNPLCHSFFLVRKKKEETFENKSIFWHLLQERVPEPHFPVKGKHS